MPLHHQDDIAIIGIACRFAGAADVVAFWRNVLDNKSAISDHPNPLAPRVLDPSSPRFDRLCTQRGGFLRELNTFTPGSFGLAAEAMAGVNPDQFMAMHLASEALRHAGMDRNALLAERAGLILGYSSPLNVATANWLQHGQVLDQTVALLQRLFPTALDAQLNEIRQTMKAALPPILPPGLQSAFGHTLAGKCATALKVSGTVCAVDAGAASSLQALRMAMDELRLGRCDLMLAGAVQNCTSLQMLMGLACMLPFSTRDTPCPLSRDADGTLPGEGGGFLLLKRRRDAEKDDNYIYALIKGVGLSASDASPQGMRTEPQGLIAAMQAGQDEAGIDPGTVSLVEAHGSGVPREDQMELAALRQVFPDRSGPSPRTLVGSIKAQIGHCYAAAGLAGVIKSALALHHCVLPPMLTSCGRMQTRLIQASSPFYVGNTPRPWIQGQHQTPRRAVVNAFDLSCMHAHAVLEEYPDNR